MTPADLRKMAESLLSTLMEIQLATERPTVECHADALERALLAAYRQGIEDAARVADSTIGHNSAHTQMLIYEHIRALLDVKP